jgi:eukaryotic-like serine/threonine-protein kinase
LEKRIEDYSDTDLQALLDTIAPGFRLIEQIGKGGQKLVYSILDEKTKETKVLKVLKHNFKSIDRLKREIRAVELINHENIPQVYETNVENVNSINDIIWIIEKHIVGKSLRDHINEKRIFNIEEVIVFFETMFSILKKSETLNIIHRDIKPENILFDIHQKFWLIDYGISRHLDLESLTDSNSPFGPCTFGYSAAEQFRNRKKDIDIRADLFSLGVVAAEMITGSNPYLVDTQDIITLIKKIENQPLPLLRINGDSQFFLAKFIKNLGDNRLSRRPRTITEVERIFEIVKKSL